MLTRDVRSPQVRGSENHSLFRRINERVRDDNREFNGVVILDEWVCECVSETCLEHVHLAPDEYDSVRADEARFVVAPGVAHVFMDVDLLVDKQKRYWVVEKVEEAAPIAGLV